MLCFTLFFANKTFSKKDELISFYRPANHYKLKNTVKAYNRTVYAPREAFCIEKRKENCAKWNDK